MREWIVIGAVGTAVGVVALTWFVAAVACIALDALL